MTGASSSVLVSEGIAGVLHPAVGEVLAAADVVASLSIVLALIIAILRGSAETCERFFACFAASPAVQSREPRKTERVPNVCTISSAVLRNCCLS